MKILKWEINLKSKRFWIFLMLAFIIVPILWNTLSSFVMGKIAEYQNSLPTEVEVATPLEKEIYPEYETTGRIEAQYSINIIARVNGWLEKRFFQEGDKVKKGQKLYQIEPDEYALEAKNAQATVNENRAVFNNSQIELRRAKTLIKEDFVSQEYYDNAVAKRNQDRAALDGSIARLNKAKLDLSYTNVIAPFDGRVGKIEITEGNYVTPQSGTLTTVYTTNPMKVNFTLKSSEFIQLKKMYLNDSNAAAPVSVSLKLADGSIYKEIGKIEFVNNKINEDTGTVTWKALFPNPDEILVPGDYVNVILTVNKLHKVMLIPQSATKTDVGTGYYVWVLGKDNTVEKREIKVDYNIDNNWVVEGGLKPDDKIIVKGIQNIYHSGQKVKVVTPDAAKNKESKGK